MTEHFTLEEFILSPTAIRLGIDNTPPSQIMTDIKRTLMGLEKIRTDIGMPIHINSGYRCDLLNRIVGSHRSSQHLKGQAADIICPKFGSPYKLAKAIEESMEHFGVDKLILEFGKWVHVSFTAIPRKEVYTIRNFNEGYLKGLIEV